MYVDDGNHSACFNFYSFIYMSYQYVIWLHVAVYIKAYFMVGLFEPVFSAKTMLSSLGLCVCVITCGIWCNDICVLKWINAWWCFVLGVLK